METVTIQKKEYKKLLEAQARYQLLKQAVSEDIFAPPPIKDSEAVISAFRAAKKYPEKFLKGLEKGLARSTYFTKRKK